MYVCVCIKLYLLNIPPTKKRDDGNPLSETAIENGNAATNKTNDDNRWIVIANPMARVGSRRWTSKVVRCEGSGQPFVQISNPWNLFVSWYFFGYDPGPWTTSWFLQDDTNDSSNETGLTKHNMTDKLSFPSTCLSPHLRECIFVSVSLLQRLPKN